MRASRFIAFLAVLAAQSIAPAFAQALPPSPPVKLAVNPITNKVYMGDGDANTVTVLDASTGAMSTIPVGRGASFIAVDPQTNRVYVNNSRDASLTVIDGATDRVIGTHNVGSSGPIAINPLTNTVYIVRLTGTGSDEVTFFNGNTSNWYTIATESFQPTAMAVNPLTNRIYVAHYATGDVRVIGGAYDNVDFPPTTSIGVYSKPYAIAVNPVSNKVYVVTEDSRGPISIINGANNTNFIPAVTAGHGVTPRAVVVNPVTNKAYAAFANEVIAVDGATNALTYIPIPNASSGNIALAVNHATNRIYAATALGSLSVIDGATDTVVGSSAIPAGTSSIGVNPITGTVYTFDSTLQATSDTAALRASPLTTTVTPLSGNASGPSGSITLNASTTFSPNAPPVRGVYYRLDSKTGPWTAATGSGPYTASFANLPSGSHTLYAFALDGQDAPLSTGPQSMPLTGSIATYTFTVASNKLNPSVSLASSQNPSQAGQSVTFTASVAGSGAAPTGTVEFRDGSTALCSAVTLAGGSATCATAALTAGSHTITAAYSGDGGYNATTSGAVTQAVSAPKVDPTIALASSKNPAVTGESVTFTATLGGTAGTPTGSVTFNDGTTALCTGVALASSAATCTTSALTSGSHSITAAYSGDAGYNTRTSSAVTQVMNAPKVDPAVALVSSKNPATGGETVIFTASVSGAAGTATGTVTFNDGSTALCTAVTVSSGSAACATSALSTGSHAVTAAYSGNGTYNARTSAALTQVVNAPRIDPAVALTTSRNPSVVGETVQFTASVSGSAGTATGSVTFGEGTTVLCNSVALDAGSASCSTAALQPGSHAITAAYSGDAGYNTRTSGTLTQNVVDPNATADLALTQSVDSDTQGSGKDSVFTLVATNNGPKQATGVTVAVTLPSNGAFIWASSGCAEASGTVTCTRDQLPQGGAAEFRVVLRAAAAGSLTSDARVSAAQFDPSGANDRSIRTVTVTASPTAVEAIRYRLYSPVTQEHLFTTDANEYRFLGTQTGNWTQEGESGKVLDNPGSYDGFAARPYYRLYNTITRWHHWTTDPNEYYTLGAFANWQPEGVDGYILPQLTSRTTALYRLVYPDGRGLHHWTIDAAEYGTLIQAYGWAGEGGTGYVIK